MKNLGLRKLNTGIGIIEVLITTLVIALGLLAVARFQLGIVGESRDNKAMVEARSYCESGIEDMRRVMSRGEFGVGGPLAENLAPTAETFSGKSASFSRTLVVENLPQPGVTSEDDVRQKRITATCSWEDGEVELQTVMSLHDATNSALATNLGGGGGPALSPSLNAGSSDDISESVPLEAGDEGYGSPGQVVLIDDEYYIVEQSGLSASKSQACSAISPVVLPFENGLRARRVDNDGYEGLEAIELFEVVEDEGTEFCVPRVRFNGGVVIPMRGIVHSRISGTDKGSYLPVELFTLNVSESGTYCVFDPDEGTTSAPYTCYVGGNCAHGPEGNDDEDFTQCPTTRPANILSTVGEGGWRGRIGLLNVASEGYNVCFFEEVETDTDSTRDTARDYFSYTTGPDNALGTVDDRHQGINKPYACHDLLIVDGVSNPNHSALRKACKAQAETIGGLRLASKVIRRDVGGGTYNNVYDPVVDISNCSELPGTDYLITGNLVNQIGSPQVVVSAGGLTWQCDVDVGSYSCEITTTEDSAQISGVQSGQSYPDPPCSVSLDPATPTVSGCTITFPESTDPTYRVSGFIFGAQAATEISASGGLSSLDVVVDNTTIGCTAGEYSDPDPAFPDSSGGRPYECSFTTSAPAVAEEKTVQLFADPQSSYSVDFIDGASGIMDLFIYDGEDPRQIAGPDLSVALVATYELSGSISIGDIGSGEVDPAVNPLESITCTLQDPNGGWKKNTSGSYSCVLPAGDRTVTYSISPKCSPAKGNKPSYKYVISGGSASSDSGSLTLDITVNSNLTRNITISLSDTPCG
ncbi:type IV pilus modification PilV family protein [Haliea atlantica]